jgi:mono/diheme cytochrome c family protein
LAVGCDDYLPGKPGEEKKYRRPETVQKFEVLYTENCAACHGAKGDLGPAPPLKDDLFRSLIPVAELEKLLNEGRPGTLMPGFALRNGGTLTETQIQVLVHEIKGIGYRVEKPGTEAAYVVADGSRSKDLKWGELHEAPAAPPLNADGPPGDAKAGLAVWSMACAKCHGPEGQGVLESKPILKLHDPAFLALSSDRVLRRYIITGRPDLGMPDFRGKVGRDPSFTPLTSEDVANLTALLAQWRTGK